MINAQRVYATPFLVSSSACSARKRKEIGDDFYTGYKWEVGKLVVDDDDDDNDGNDWEKSNRTHLEKTKGKTEEIVI